MEMFAIQIMHWVVYGGFPYNRCEQYDHPETIATENFDRSFRLGNDRTVK